MKIFTTGIDIQRPEYWQPLYSYTTADGKRICVEGKVNGGSGDVRSIEVKSNNGSD